MYRFFVCLFVFSRYCSHGDLGLDFSSSVLIKILINRSLEKGESLVCSICRFLKCKRLPPWPISNN